MKDREVVIPLPGGRIPVREVFGLGTDYVSTVKGVRSMVKVGDPVVYVDPTATPRPAVVTAVFGGPYTEEERARLRSGYYGGEGMTDEQIASSEATRVPPSLNLVFVSPDGAKGDTYGRQVERATSIPHRTKQAAHGNYWREMTPADLQDG